MQTELSRGQSGRDTGTTIALHRGCLLVQNRRPIPKRKNHLCQLEHLSTSVSTPSIPKNTADGTANSLRASSTQTTCKRWRKPRDSPKKQNPKQKGAHAIGSWPTSKPPRRN